MNEDEIRRVERELGVTLPEEYARLLREDPFDGGVQDFYGEADEIIEGNNFMRYEGYVRPWPMNWLIIGDDGAGDDYILDLDLAASPVFFLDHELYKDREHLDRAVRVSSLDLTTHLEEVKAGLREFYKWIGHRVNGDLLQFRRRLIQMTEDTNPPPIHETLAQVLDIMAGAEDGVRRVGTISLLPSDFARAGLGSFDDSYGVCRIRRLSDGDGLPIWLWRDDRSDAAETVVLAATSVDSATARSAVLSALPSLSPDVLRWDSARTSCRKVDCAP